VESWTIRTINQHAESLFYDSAFFIHIAQIDNIYYINNQLLIGYNISVYN